jgi:hypothetical protein
MTHNITALIAHAAEYALNKPETLRLQDPIAPQSTSFCPELR